MKKFISAVLAVLLISSILAVFPATSAIGARGENTEVSTVSAYSDEIVSFEIARLPVKTEYREKTDSTLFEYYDERSGERVSTEIYDLKLAGMKVKIGYRDGTEREYIYENHLELFAGIFTDASNQIASPWGVGRHTVNVYFGKFSDSFEIEVVPNPYVKAEIIKLPNVTKSYKEINRERSGDYFVYTPDLLGLVVRLTRADGTYDDAGYNSLTARKFTVSTDQSAKEQWGEGVHTVEVFYGSMSVGTYDFTVSYAEVTSFYIENPPTAVYYTKSNEGKIYAEDMTLEVLFTDGSRESVTYDDIMQRRGAGGLFTFSSDDKAGEYYIRCTSGAYIRGAYRESDELVDAIEVTSAPAVFANVENFGMIVDMTGCTVKVTMGNGEVRYWSYSEDFAGGSGLLYDDVFSWSKEEDGLCFSYMNGSLKYTAYKTPHISVFSSGLIDKGTTVTVDFADNDFIIYTLRPRVDGIYSFSTEGTCFVSASVYKADGSLDEDMLFYSNLVNGEPNFNFTLDLRAGGTYYIVLHKFAVEEEIGDGKVKFTVSRDFIGDANGDGEINLQDVLAIRKYIVDLAGEGEVILANADVNGDGDVNIQDVIMIRKYIVGIIEEL